MFLNLKVISCCDINIEQYYSYFQKCELGLSQYWKIREGLPQSRLDELCI